MDICESFVKIFVWVGGRSVEVEGLRLRNIKWLGVAEGLARPSFLHNSQYGHSGQHRQAGQDGQTGQNGPPVVKSELAGLLTPQQNIFSKPPYA